MSAPNPVTSDVAESYFELYGSIRLTVKLLIKVCFESYSLQYGSIRLGKTAKAIQRALGAMAFRAVQTYVFYRERYGSRASDLHQRAESYFQPIRLRLASLSKRLLGHL